MSDELREVFGDQYAVHLATWRENAGKDLVEGRPFTAHPRAIIALIDAALAARPDSPSPDSTLDVDAAWKRHKSGHYFADPNTYRVCRDETYQMHGRHRMFAEGWLAHEAALAAEAPERPA